MPRADAARHVSREHVALERLRVDARLEAAVEREVGREVERAAVLQAHLPPRVVREDVARGVVRERGRDPAEPGALLDVREHRVDALVGEVAREGEGRGLEGAASSRGNARASVALAQP